VVAVTEFIPKGERPRVKGDQVGASLTWTQGTT
jgi:hypothetical protein